MKAEVHTLDNGVSVILAPDVHIKTVCVTVGVAVGANHETDREHGLAHFFEHMCFKGTEHYPDHTQLAVRMDESGLVGNAYTGREYTGYYLLGRSERIADMIELTAEIFLRSLFPERDLEKEKGVIVEEIAMYEDDPEAKAASEVEQSLFHGTAVEHDILGTVDSVHSFSRDDFIRFLGKHYTAGNTVISVAGGFDAEEVLAALKEIYAVAPNGTRSDQIAVSPRGVKNAHTSIVRANLEQAHINIAGYAPAFTDTDRYAAILFSVLLGGSMSSRLFLRVREHLGACYSIRSSVSSATTYGTFYIHTGINGKRVGEVTEAIAEECAAVKNAPVTDDEVRKAREYALGVRAIQQQSAATVAMRNMQTFARIRTIVDEEEYEKQLKAVTPEDVRRVARAILNPKAMALCYVGNTDVPADITESFCTVMGS